MAFLALIYLAANAGLLILGIEPNPRHPPRDLWEEALGWAHHRRSPRRCLHRSGRIANHEGRTRGFFISHKGLIIGAAIGWVLALFFSTNLAVLQMPSVDGQAITSVSLGIMAGATVGFLGAVGGIVLGFVLRRSVLAIAS